MKIAYYVSALAGVVLTAGAFAGTAAGHRDLVASASAGGPTGGQAGHTVAPITVTPWFVSDTLLFALWVTVAAILVGPVIKWLIGDLWQRKTAQPFTDDPGHAAAGHAAPLSHH